MTELKNYSAYINGEWISGNREKLPVENPADNEIFATVPDCTVEDAQRALETSKEAQKKWQAIPAPARGELLMDIVRRLAAERDKFAVLLVKEQGKTLKEAYGEVDDTMRYISYSAEAARRIEGNIFPSDKAKEQIWIQKVPYGVTLGLCANNYPLALIGRKIGPALVTGNTMILKPHESTPVTAAEFCRIADEAGLPPGVINLVTGRGIDVSAHLVESPITQLITVTGSTPAGRAIYRGASKNITAVSLELGGKAPFIVLDDADVDKAAAAAVASRYVNCGQVCICSENVLVHEKIADQFTEKVIEHASKITYGDPMTDVNMGPTVVAEGLTKFSRIISESVEMGAEIALGGKKPEGGMYEKGYWFEPTVLTNVTPEMAAAKEEIFGPILPITKISGFEEAVEINNSRNDGLSSYLFTKDYAKIMDAADRLQVGTIFVNREIAGFIQGYHSGHKTSGLGGEDGIYGIEGYLQKKAIYFNYDI